MRNTPQGRAGGGLNPERLDHFPDMQAAMLAAHGDDRAHGLSHSRPISHDTAAQERASWQAGITHVQALTGKRLQGRRGGGAGDPGRTDEVMAEAGGLSHPSWLIADQPWPIHGRGGPQCLAGPSTGPTNAAGLLAWHRDAEDCLPLITDPCDTRYRAGADNGRVLCLARPPHTIGRPNAATHLDEALRSILGHDGVWTTTAADSAEDDLAHGDDQVSSWIAARHAQPEARPTHGASTQTGGGWSCETGHAGLTMPSSG